MMQTLNNYGPYIEAVLLALVISVPICFGMYLANERMQQQPAHVLTTEQALAQGWPAWMGE